MVGFHVVRQLNIFERQTQGSEKSLYLHFEVFNQIDAIK